MNNIMGLSLDIEDAKEDLEKNALWWFEYPPYTMVEFDEMVKNGELMVVDKKWRPNRFYNGIAKNYESTLVKKYEDNMRITAMYTTERAQKWENAKKICEIRMVKEQNTSTSPTLEKLRENCKKSAHWITETTREIQTMKINKHYAYHAQYLYGMIKYLDKLENMLNDLEFELHWKMLQIEGKNQNVAAYIQNIRECDFIE